MASTEVLAAVENYNKKQREMLEELSGKIQLKMSKCAVSCCENKGASREQNQKCIDKCSAGFNTAQRYVEREMKNFQAIAQTCMLHCQAKAKDRAGLNSSVEEIEKTTALFEVCTTRCFDNQIKLMPKLLQRMKEGLDTNPENSSNSTRVHHVI